VQFVFCSSAQLYKCLWMIEADFTHSCQFVSVTWESSLFIHPMMAAICHVVKRLRGFCYNVCPIFRSTFCLIRRPLLCARMQSGTWTPTVLNFIVVFHSSSKKLTKIVIWRSSRKSMNKHFFTCKSGTADEGEYGVRWNQLLVLSSSVSWRQ